MTEIFIFIILSIPIVIVSWRTFFDIKSHGFYRFYSWEFTLCLLVSNYKYWFVDWLGTKQIISWVFLVYALYTVAAGMKLLRNAQSPHFEKRDDEALFQFEKTTELVETGIFKFIRHPLYGSLIFLTWGIFLKRTTISLFIISFISTALLYYTARIDEKECLEYFGDKYKVYMRKTKMFIPFLF
jgi:protein-S-isoprenylcysteine O-methyltransferase Ste14